MSNWYSMFVSDRSSPYKWGNVVNNYLRPFLEDLTGYTQKKNTQKSLQTQIEYEQYLKKGNERAYHDWQVRNPGKRIRYPEFSYPGQIARANTSIARAGLDYDTARANYTGNFLFRTAGLYGIGSRLFRTL